MKGIPINNYRKFGILKDLQKIEIDSTESSDTNNDNPTVRRNIHVLTLILCTGCVILSICTVVIFIKKQILKCEEAENYTVTGTLTSITR